MKRAGAFWVIGVAIGLGASGATQAQVVEQLDEAVSLTPVDPVGPPKPVVVVNELTQPVPVTGIVNIGNAGVLQPFQESLRSIDPPFQVPEGKRLIIEYVSGVFGEGLDCEVNFVELRTSVSVGGKEKRLTHIFPTAERPGELNGVFGQQTRIYADPGTEVQGLVETDPNDCGASFVMTVSGQLVDVP